MVILIVAVASMQKILTVAGALWKRGKWIKLVYKTITLLHILFLEVKKKIYTYIYRIVSLKISYIYS